MKPIRKIIASIVVELDTSSGVEMELQDAATAIKTAIQVGLKATVTEVRVYPLATSDDTVTCSTSTHEFTSRDVDTVVEQYVHSGHTIEIWQDAGKRKPWTFFATLARPGAIGGGSVMKGSESSNINRTKEAAEGKAERQTAAAAKRAAKLKTS